MDDVERGIIDVQLHVAAQGFLAATPAWFRDLSRRHHELVRVISDAGFKNVAEEVDRHGPCLDEGVMCAENNLPYPCTKVRFLAWDTSFADEIAAKWDREWPVWRRARCGVDTPEEMWLDW